MRLCSLKKQKKRKKRVSYVYFSKWCAGKLTRIKTPFGRFAKRAENSPVFLAVPFRDRRSKGMQVLLSAFIYGILAHAEWRPSNTSAYLHTRGNHLLFSASHFSSAGKSTRDKNSHRKTSLRETYCTDIKKKNVGKSFSYFIGIIIRQRRRV